MRRKAGPASTCATTIPVLSRAGERQRRVRPLIWSVSLIVRLAIPVVRPRECASAGSIPDPSGSEDDVPDPGRGAALRSRFGT